MNHTPRWQGKQKWVCDNMDDDRLRELQERIDALEEKIRLLTDDQTSGLNGQLDFLEIPEAIVKYASHELR